jgi:hypothetical protein
MIFHPFDEAGRNVFAETAHGRDCLALLGLAPDRIVMATTDLEVEECCCRRATTTCAPARATTSGRSIAPSSRRHSDDSLVNRI